MLLSEIHKSCKSVKASSRDAAPFVHSGASGCAPLLSTRAHPHCARATLRTTSPQHANRSIRRTSTRPRRLTSWSLWRRMC